MAHATERRRRWQTASARRALDRQPRVVFSRPMNRRKFRYSSFCSCWCSCVVHTLHPQLRWGLQNPGSGEEYWSGPQNIHGSALYPSSRWLMLSFTIGLFGHSACIGLFSMFFFPHVPSLLQRGGQTEETSADCLVLFAKTTLPQNSVWPAVSATAAFVNEVFYTSLKRRIPGRNLTIPTEAEPDTYAKKP
ncbi:hypothetical protein FN846DRAFT_572991 [Sphaerosporella brunnea]|uniref:Uncharacterized protein n=1 Tax=Sphaerosporella brunnea TaxID=1250544 RepID=A0A5J5ECH2_9PEZI|nr:hypothetical protein FN846DRAFT_572991 [Sphaerosporella brunnea]